MQKHILQTLASSHSLVLLVALLLVVIPLYPKLPLFEVIPGYIVRIRLEDFLILAVSGVWLYQTLRKKTSLSTPLTTSLLLYICCGGISVLSAVLILKTVPLESSHILKTVLHYVRNIQYIVMFFVGYSAVKTKKDFNVLVTVMLATLTVVGIYGIGQKYFQLPVYSTMNREFSAGIQLVLTNHARVQSTFAGHYDLAAYLVLLLPLVLSLILSLKKTSQAKWLWALFVVSTWLLTVAAARTSYVGALISVYIVILYYALTQSTVAQKLGYFLQRGFIVGVIFLVLMIQFGSDIRERLLHALQGYPKMYALYQQTSNLFPRTENTEIDDVMVNSDAQPVPKKPNDVTVDVPDLVPTATVAADGSTKIIIIEQERTWSDNALRYGLSMAIRLDTLWPQAIAGFTRSPIFGSGYATLTKSETSEFTEADSTDNNYLRTLGETGLAGFVTFYGSILLALSLAWKQLKTKELSSQQAPAIAYVAGTLGLLFNAIYIDVFVASKVALIFWLYTGILLAREKFKTEKS